MPCSKASITKTYKCDKDGCLCIPTNGAARVCLSVNETNSIIRCDCECDTKCECNENCTCINTAGLSCICVCRDQNGRIKTCEDCSCHPKEAQTQSCKGRSNVTCSCNTGNEKCACLNCSCEPVKNKCGEGSCKAKKGESGCECKGKPTCACIGSACKSKQVDGSCKDRTRQSTNCSGNCDKNCKCSCVEQDDAFKANVCARKACAENCKCQGNANSCVCICKNKQEETVCCDDCKCDGSKTCDKKECICVRKESSCKCKSVEASCCGSCDEKCKYPGRKPEAASKALIGNCKCQGNANSCVCVCKDIQGKNVCCDDCKCDGNNRCDKEGFVCIRKESSRKSVKTNYCENCDEKCKCSVDQNTSMKANNCAGKDCGENCRCQGNSNSCVCICKNKQGESVCCDDCKCDNHNICDKKGCICVPQESSCKCKSVKFSCCENCDAKCKCSCVDQEAAFNANSGAGKVCVENCKCEGNGNSCVCICRNKQGKSICCDDCKCDDNNTCDKKGCVCVPRETMTCNKTMTCKSGCCCRNAIRSCVCMCKNKQELVCCDDCRCDGTNTCDRKGCICVPKEDSCKVQPMKPNCCENCDVKCKCSCVDQELVFNANSRARKFCAGNCKCQGNENSCVCICMNKQGESICCDDCKCDNNNICDKKGCVCICKESSCKRKSVKASCCENCKCCVDDELLLSVFKTNNCAGEACNANCKCLGNANSCVCICKNKQGETICCEDCKCDGNNRCEKKECTCIPSESVTCNKKAEPKCCC